VSVNQDGCRRPRALTHLRSAVIALQKRSNGTVFIETELLGSFKESRSVRDVLGFFVGKSEQNIFGSVSERRATFSLREQHKPVPLQGRWPPHPTPKFTAIGLTHGPKLPCPGIRSPASLVVRHVVFPCRVGRWINDERTPDYLNWLVWVASCPRFDSGVEPCFANVAPWSRKIRESLHPDGRRDSRSC
jgi:hypothetical protein